MRINLYVGIVDSIEVWIVRRGGCFIINNIIDDVIVVDCLQWKVVVVDIISEGFSVKQFLFFVGGEYKDDCLVEGVLVYDLS